MLTSGGLLGGCCVTDASPPPPPSPPLTELWYGLSPSPPHEGTDWGGYTSVPVGATLTDRRMCDDYLWNYYNGFDEGMTTGTTQRAMVNKQ